MFTHQVIRQSQSLRVRACRAAFSTSSKPDVIILGAGHNGLVAATLLARQGLQVRLLPMPGQHELLHESNLTPAPYSPTTGSGARS